jgi:hypothetical protein
MLVAATGVGTHNNLLNRERGNHEKLPLTTIPEVRDAKPAAHEVPYQRLPWRF